MTEAQSEHWFFMKRKVYFIKIFLTSLDEHGPYFRREWSVRRIFESEGERKRSVRCIFESKGEREWWSAVRYAKPVSMLAMHHLYSGIALILFAFYLITTGYITLGPIISVVGLWFVVDDLVQHNIQMKEYEVLGAYHTLSFLNWFPRLAWRKLVTLLKR